MAPIPLVVLAGLAASFLLAPAAPAGAQAVGADASLTAERVIAAAYRTESELIGRMRDLQPMVEAYIQELSTGADRDERPVLDTYFLGRFGWDGGPELELLVDEDQGRNVRKTRINYLPDGFASMAAPDWAGLSPSRYDFTFVRREFLGEARTFVFDVAPRDGPKGGFSGRIWVEDREFHIVRFNGINRRTRGNWFRRRFRQRLTFRVDGWRVNIRPGVWVPAYVYCEEPYLKSQVRFWGYEPEITDLSDEFTSIEILDPAIQGNAGQPNQLPPVQSQRRWEEEAEANVLERLERARLLARPGDVEVVLNTVLNNLIVTNDIVHQRHRAEPPRAGPRPADLAARVLHAGAHHRPEPWADRRAAQRSRSRNDAGARTGPRGARARDDRHPVRLCRPPHALRPGIPRAAGVRSRR